MATQRFSNSKAENRYCTSHSLELILVKITFKNLILKVQSCDLIFPPPQKTTTTELWKRTEVISPTRCHSEMTILIFYNSQPLNLLSPTHLESFGWGSLDGPSNSIFFKHWNIFLVSNWTVSLIHLIVPE